MGVANDDELFLKWAQWGLKVALDRAAIDWTEEAKLKERDVCQRVLRTT